jgi:polyisoprenoid-binding protein YceI
MLIGMEAGGPHGTSVPRRKELSVNRKPITWIVSAIVALGVIFALVFFVIFPLGAKGKLPFQSHPTAIPVTPFANLGSTAPAGTAVSSAPMTAAATSAPVTTPTTSAAATTASSPSPAPSTTTASASAASPTQAAASAPSGNAAATTSGTTFTVVGDQSQAQVTVNEKLARLPTNSDAVLTTNAMQGQIVLGPDTKPTNASKIQVDLRTLKSDKTQRDNYIRQNTLQSDQFPLAEYTITGVEGWNGPLQNGQQATFRLLGTMTIHGVTKPIAFDTTATMTGDALNGTAKTSFTFEDFGMSAPKLAIVTANDKIDLVMTIVAKKAA